MTEPVSPLSGANVRTLTERLCEVEAVLDVVGRLGAELRAELLARAIGRWREDGTAPTFRAPGLGSVSLSVPQQKVVVVDVDEFASWVAQKHPDAATGRVIVACPPAALEGLLDSIRVVAAGDPTTRELVRVTADVEVSPAFTRRLLDSEVAVADAGETKAAIDTTTGEVIDGVRVDPGADPARPDGPQPRSISVRLEPQAKADAAAQAQARLAAVLERGLSDALAVDVRELSQVDAAVEAALAAPVDHSIPSHLQLLAAGNMPAVDDAAGEPDEACECGHPRWAAGLHIGHGGKTGAGKCSVPDCPCKRFRVPAVAW